jgi:phytoene dehydrogenase-like protein
VADHDAIIVGSGINSLACAAFLARAGWNVAVLERERELGGAVRTAELTEPGFQHDVFSAWHPLWVGGPAHAELGAELEKRGLQYLNTEHPTGTLLPDGESAFLTTSTDGNATELERHAAGDGDAWRRTIEAVGSQAELVFGVLGTELWSPAGLNLGVKAFRRLGRRGFAEFGAEVVQSSRDWLTGTFRSERAHGLLAPWVLHTGLGPDAAASGFMTRVIAFAIEAGGMPIPRGGGARLVDALRTFIEDHGGVCERNRDVERVLVTDGRATGVRLTGGEARSAGRAVICNVTPAQLYGRLLDAGDVPPDVAEAGRAFRFGRSEMQIHFALSEPPGWEGDDRLGETAIVHVTPGLDGVSHAVNEAERGLLPAEATVVVGQPLTMDQSRAPEGMGLLWIQLQELPWHVRGDAAGQIDTGNGTWTESLRERYADRIQQRLARHIPTFESSILRRVVLSPADLQAANINLAQGDPYSGSLALDQNFLWRPFARQPGHRTPVEGLFHIGASTWPGPGLGAGSGTLVAQALLQPRAPVRLAGRLSSLLRPRQA